MKYLLLIGFVAWSVAVYNAGFSACKLEYVSNSESAYKQQLMALQARQDELLVQVAYYQRASVSVRSDAERLRSELRRATLSNTRIKSCPAGTDTGGWAGKMAAVLERATDLISERDEIALKYNELKEQCRAR